ncbi:MAG: S8 family serine peptidase [Gammaproteobacteria bacterium]|nr:S8 family serine peptidase [Gammaproteobacteria bacterium]
MSIEIARFTTRLVTVAVFLFPCAQSLAADPQRNLLTKDTKLNYVPGEVLVKYKGNTSSSYRAVITEGFGHQALRSLDKKALVHHIKIKAEQDVESAVASYQSDPNVEYAQPNYLYKLLARPNDVRYGDLWGLKNNGQIIADPSYSSNNPGISGKDMDAELAWDQITDCSSVIVAVLDSGVNYTHSDLVANMWNGGARYPNHGWDFQDNDNDPMPTDGNGHGTHVAGTIGAVGNNRRGTTGVCWDVQIMAIRAGDVRGFTTSNIIRGIEFAADNGARIINMSLGGEQPFDRAFNDAINYAHDRKVLVVVAAGNKGVNNEGGGTDGDLNTQIYPCNFTQDNLICVAALDQAYQRANFSNYGVVSVDVGAPGTNTWSTWPGRSIKENFDGFQKKLASGDQTSYEETFTPNLLLEGQPPDNEVPSVTFTFEGIPSPTADGVLTVTAARDINNRSETIGVFGDGVSLGSLFTVINDANSAEDLPTVTDSITIPQSTLASIAADGSITFLLDPTSLVDAVRYLSLTLSLTGTTASSNWAAVTCQDTRILVNPSNWCAAGLYANSTDDRTWNQYDLGGLLGAGASFWVSVDVVQSDFGRIAYDPNGGDPFVSGILLQEISDLFTGHEFLPIQVQYDLSSCLTSACSFGFRIVSDAAATNFGLAIKDFEINTAEPNSRRYKNTKGTSMAAPHVAGLAAMIWAYNPDYTYQDVINSIKRGGEIAPSLMSITTTGKSVNAIRSLRYINSPTGVSATVE